MLYEISYVSVKIPLLGYIIIVYMLYKIYYIYEITCIIYQISFIYI